MSMMRDERAGPGAARREFRFPISWSQVLTQSLEAIGIGKMV